MEKKDTFSSTVKQYKYSVRSQWAPYSLSNEKFNRCVYKMFHRWTCLHGLRLHLSRNNMREFRRLSFYRLLWRIARIVIIIVIVENENSFFNVRVPSPSEFQIRIHHSSYSNEQELPIFLRDSMNFFLKDIILLIAMHLHEEYYFVFIFSHFE